MTYISAKSTLPEGDFGGLLRTRSCVESYKGETYRLERREIVSFNGPDRHVWCWEVLSGSAKGQYGGKCDYKEEARKWARYAIRVVGPLSEVSEGN